MAKLLHIEASPKRERSTSSQLASWFLEAYTAKQPNDSIETLNLFETQLPEFGADAAHAKLAPFFGEATTDAQEQVWEQIKNQIAHLNAADKILISCPMWNYSVPYPLKHYFDLVMQPGITFGYDREKMVHFGLLENRPVQLILTRSSIPPGDYGDFQLPYLRFVLGAMGLNDIRTIVAWQTTKLTQEERSRYIESFIEECRQSGASF